MKWAPAVALAVGYGAGLATGLLRFGDPLGAGLLLAALALVLHQRPASSVLIAAALAGRVAAAVAWASETARCAPQLPPGDITLIGVPRDPAAGQVPVRFALDRACTGDIQVRWSAATPPVGERVRVTGRWIPRAEGPAGRPGGVLVARSVAAVPGPVPAALGLRARVLAITAHLYGSRAPLVDALLFDRRGALDPELRHRYAAAGLVHLLSISGFHVGLIVAWILLAARAARLSYRNATLLAAGSAVAYVSWLGWPAPATRAAALALVVCQGKLRQRQAAPGSLLSVTALGVLLVDPWAIFDIGAWLSVGSLWGATHFSRWSDAALGPRALWRTLMGSVGATLATAPVTAAALGTVAIAGIALNFVGIPLAAVAVPGAIASVLAAPLSDALAGTLAAGSGLALEGLGRLAALGAAFPGGHLTVAAEPRSALPWILTLGAALWVMGMRNTRTVALTRGLLALSVVAAVAVLGDLGTLAARGRGHGLRLDFLDVGQGDAALIRTPGGHAILVDAGPNLEGADAGRRVVVPFLADAGVTRLDAAVLSHAHLDHFGGMAAVLDRVPSPFLFEPGEAVADSAYLHTLDAAAADGVGWAPLRAGDTLRVDGVTLIVLHPDTSWAEWGLDLNEDSAVLLLEWGRFTALLSGDAGFRAEQRLAGHVGRVDLLKVGHHGSRWASSTAWLKELRPEAAVISVGRVNRYGHPSPEALERLSAAGASVWRTDRDGEVAVEVDSATMTIRGRGRTERFPLGVGAPVHR